MQLTAIFLCNKCFFAICFFFFFIFSIIILEKKLCRRIILHLAYKLTLFEFLLFQFKMIKVWIIIYIYILLIAEYLILSLARNLYNHSYIRYNRISQLYVANNPFKSLLEAFPSFNRMQIAVYTDKQFITAEKAN